ncbi:MAG: hypothetical protein RLZ98_328 [Pseudomonadota bacterium]|jgi:MFS family permease
MADTAQEHVPLRLQAGVYLCGVFSNSMSNLVSVVLPLWLVTLNPTPFMIGLVLGSRQFLPFLLSIHGGAVIDKVGARRVILIFGIVLAVATFMFPFTSSLPLLILVQMLTGLAGTMAWIGTQTMVGERMKSDVLYAGRLSFASNIGILVGPPVTGALWDFAGPFAAFSFIALWGAGIVAGVALIPKSEEETKGTAARLDWRHLLPNPMDYWEAFKLMAIPAILLVVVISVLRQSGQGVMVSFYVVYLESLGYTGTAIGLLLSAYSLLGAVSTLSSGWLARQFSAYWLLIAMAAASIALVSITPLIGSVYALLFLAMALRGGSIGILQSLMISIVMKAAGDTAKGKAIGLRASANRLAMTFIPIIMGAVVEFTGIENAFLSVGAVLIVLLLGVAVYVKRTPGFKDV